MFKEMSDHNAERNADHTWSRTNIEERLMPTKWYLSTKWGAWEKDKWAFADGFWRGGVYKMAPWIRGATIGSWTFWPLQNGCLYRGVWLLQEPCHFVSITFPGAQPFCWIFLMPHILCLQQGGVQPHRVNFNRDVLTNIINIDPGKPAAEVSQT